MVEVEQKQINAETVIEAFHKRNLPMNNAFAAAMQWLEEKGIPEVRNERYKYSNILRELNKHCYPIAPATDSIITYFNVDKHLPNYSLDGILVTMNGVLHAEMTQLPASIQVASKTDFSNFENIISAHQNDALVAINSLLANRGVEIQANQNHRIFWIDYYQAESEVFFNSKNTISVPKNCQLEIHHILVSNNRAPVFVNDVTKVECAENSQFSIHQIHQNDTQISASRHIFVNQQKNSKAEISQICTGGTFLRNNIQISHLGVNCESKLNGLSLAGNGNHIDNHTLVEHLHPHCNSDEMYKNIVADGGTAIFNGKVYVAKDAQKTNAYQSNKNLLLGPEAKSYSKPELEIYADDVKCSHGSTTGHSDTEALFYMRARGIKESEARKLLMLAFANDLLERIENDDLLDYLKEIVLQKFEQLMQE